MFDHKTWDWAVVHVYTNIIGWSLMAGLMFFYETAPGLIATAITMCACFLGFFHDPTNRENFFRQSRIAILLVGIVAAVLVSYVDSVEPLFLLIWAIVYVSCAWLAEKIKERNSALR